LFDPEDVAGIISNPSRAKEDTFLRRSSSPGITAHCRQHGIMFIVDEVQSGMGRTGKWWASEHAGIEPDILWFREGIASGMTVGRDHRERKRDALGAGRPRHDVRRKSSVPCRGAGHYGSDRQASTRKMLIAWATTSSGAWQIGRKTSRSSATLRGRGLMIGIEIVRDQRTKERAADLRNLIVDLAFHKAC